VPFFPQQGLSVHQKSIVSPGAKPAMVMYGFGVETSHGQLQAAQQQEAWVQWSSAPSW